MTKKKTTDRESTRSALMQKRTGHLEPMFRESVSTGSTLLNLAISDSSAIGFSRGLYYFLVGDSQSGKTWLSLSCLAEAARDTSFDEYQFIYDNVENGALMDISRFFGQKVADRIQAPRYDGKLPVYSELTEDFFFNLSHRLELGPCIYILDSMDALTSSREVQRFDDAKAAYNKGEYLGDDMTDNKAKINSKGLRAILPKLRDTGSILVIINQTRDSIGGGPFQSKTRSGGHALKFYSHVEIWSSVVKTLKKTIRGKERSIGVNVRLKIKKNRITGKSRQVDVPIFYDYGMDDIGSCIDYLIDESRWKKTGTTIGVGTDFGGSVKPMRRSALIAWIEENNKEEEIRKIVEEVWLDVEKACGQDRKRRYE